jgi:hypothetical protein
MDNARTSRPKPWAAGFRLSTKPCALRLRCAQHLMRRSSHPVRLPAVAHQNTGIVLQEFSDQFLAALADVIQFRLVWFNRSLASFMSSSSFDDNERITLSFSGVKLESLGFIRTHGRIGKCVNQERLDTDKLGNHKRHHSLSLAKVGCNPFRVLSGFLRFRPPVGLAAIQSTPYPGSCRPAMNVGGVRCKT